MKLKSRVGPKGQVVIPKSIRDALGIRPDDVVLFDVEGGKATLEVVMGDPIKFLEEIARLYGTESSKLVWGERLYEEALEGS
ncbi:AbrB/MazE/SpoVT family DNA-binding domain-containing protein [Candidatus Bathyarchaeota archaeon]|nr:AbrB/MazE/SpoVT family DNA-binding domain-containing protein [Candidatus Bathyarchaeota archaeon]